MALQIVLIEPSAPARQWIRLMLREAGIPHDVREFRSVLVALQDLREGVMGKVDLVIVNIVLPVLEVSEAVARLRELPAVADAVCAITVLDEHDGNRIPNGCHALVKPVSTEALRTLLQNLEYGAG